MLAYKRFTACLLLFMALVAVSQCQDETAVDPRLQKICDTLVHLKKDFQRYFGLYKDLVIRFNKSRKLKGNNKCREELNRMFEILKELMNMIREMEEIKEELFSPDNSNTLLVDTLERWIIKILNMVADLADIATAVLKCEKKATAMQDLIATFRELNANCLDVSQDNLIAVMATEAAKAVATTSDAGDMIVTDPNGGVRLNPGIILWQEPVSSFWQKISIMRRLCQQFIRCFIRIRQILLKLDLKENYPYREMQRLCGCLVQLCRSGMKLMNIRLAALRMSSKDLEKALCEWLMELMEIRVRLMDYYNDLIKAVAKISPGNEQSIIDCIKPLFELLDNCLLKMQCWYIEMVQDGGPKRFPQ